MITAYGIILIMNILIGIGVVCASIIVIYLIKVNHDERVLLFRLIKAKDLSEHEYSTEQPAEEPTDSVRYLDIDDLPDTGEIRKVREGV